MMENAASQFKVNRTSSPEKLERFRNGTTFWKYEQKYAVHSWAGHFEVWTVRDQLVDEEQEKWLMSITYAGTAALLQSYQ